MDQKKIAVIGAGISGLSCAYELQKKGFKVKVFESEDHVGGRMATRKIGNFPFDMGAQVFATNYTAAQEYCDELGIADHWEVSSTHNNYVFRDAELHVLHKSSLAGCLSKKNNFYLWLLSHDLKSLTEGLDLFSLGSESSEIDETNAHEYLMKLTNNQILDYIIDPLFNGNNFYSIQNTSATAILAGMKFAYFDIDKFCYLTEKGLGYLPEKLSEQLDIALSTPIKKIESIHQGNTEDNASVQVELKGGLEVYDAVVLAVPAYIASTIYLNPTSCQQEFLSGIQYSCTITISLRVPAIAIENIAMGFVPESESEMITSFVGQTIKGEGATFENQGLINFFLRDSFAKKVMGYSNESIFDLIRGECIRVCPVLKPYTSEIVDYDLQRWPQAIPMISPGFLTKVYKFLKDEQGKNNVFLCGDYLASPYVEGSIRCGQRVAKEVIRKFES
jgi:protoporphyrinogen/coproporphyrinogen III oxidase